MKLPLALTIFFLAATAHAQEVTPERVLFIDGECAALSVGEEDLQAVCAPEVTQVTYVGGRIELFVSTESADGRFLVFGGQGTKGEDAMLQDVDSVIVSLDPMGDSQKTYPASGQCRHGDAFAGPARFTCAVTDESGKSYGFDFVSDGAVPEDALG
jgi:hypothetical protein